MELIKYLGVLVVGGVLGYQWCLLRWRPKDMIKLLDLYIAHMTGNITIEYFNTEFKRLFGDLK